MKNILRYTVLICLITLCGIGSLKAQSSTDSFFDHTEKYFSDGLDFVKEHKFDSAKHCFNLAQRECYVQLRKQPEDTLYLKLLGSVQIAIGKTYFSQSEYRLAERSFQEALLTARRFGGKKEMGYALHSLGATYSQIGDIDRAYQNYQKAIFFEKTATDSVALANTLNNIGETFYLQYEYSTAISFLNEALTIKKLIGNFKGQAETLNNLAQTYIKMNKLDSARLFMNRAKKISARFKDSLSLARIYRNEGEFLIRKKQYSSSITPLKKCLKINVLLQNKLEIAMCYKLMAEAYLKVGILEEAERYAHQSLDMGIRYNLVEVKVEVLGVLSEAFLLQKNYKNALLLKKEYKSAKDSFINKANNARLYELKMIYQANSKDQALKQKKDEIELHSLSRKRFQSELLFYTMFIIGFVLVLLFLFWIYRTRVKNEQRLRNKQRYIEEQKEQILTQMNLLEQHANNVREHNEEIKQQNSHLETKKTEIKRQTLVLEQQRTEVLDSMFYAQKIQKAVFSSFYVNQHSDADDFFAFVAGDIISSSFVWRELCDDKYVYMIVDSLTPGILSSLSTLMVYTQMKNWIAKSKRMKAEDINRFFEQKVNELIEEEFGVTLHISTLLFYPKERQVEFVGAHSLWVVDEKSNAKQECEERKQTALKQTETIYIFSNSYSNLLDAENLGLLFNDLQGKTSKEKKKIVEGNIPERRKRATSDFFMLGLRATEPQ